MRAASATCLRPPRPRTACGPPRRSARARAVLRGQEGVEGVGLTDGELRFAADEETVARAAITLGQARIGITALVPETASLEELFLGLTGGESSDHDREAVA